VQELHLNGPIIIDPRRLMTQFSTLITPSCVDPYIGHFRCSVRFQPFSQAVVFQALFISTKTSNQAQHMDMNHKLKAGGTRGLQPPASRINGSSTDFSCPRAISPCLCVVWDWLCLRSILCQFRRPGHAAYGVFRTTQSHPTFFFFCFADYIPIYPHPALDTGISSQSILSV
jgi:hypothetical protein